MIPMYKSVTHYPKRMCEALLGHSTIRQFSLVVRGRSGTIEHPRFSLLGGRFGGSDSCCDSTKVTRGEGHHPDKSQGNSYGSRARVSSSRSSTSSEVTPRTLDHEYETQHTFYLISQIFTEMICRFVCLISLELTCGSWLSTVASLVPSIDV